MDAESIFAGAGWALAIVLLIKLMLEADLRAQLEEDIYRTSLLAMAEADRSELRARFNGESA